MLAILCIINLIRVDVKITLNQVDYIEKNIKIGRLPIMLGSSKCNLYNKSFNELVAMNECPYDITGYFIVKGVEKVILI